MSDRLKGDYETQDGQTVWLSCLYSECTQWPQIHREESQLCETTITSDFSSVSGDDSNSQVSALWRCLNEKINHLARCPDTHMAANITINQSPELGAGRGSHRGLTRCPGRRGGLCGESRRERVLLSASRRPVSLGERP